jgi:spermidine synthase
MKAATVLTPSWSDLISSLPSLPSMPETQESVRHVKPFVYESHLGKALHFSICEIQSRMKIEDPYSLDLEYTRTMMGVLLFNAQPDSIAMIGLGGGSLAKFCYRYLPKSRIQVVEINPHVIALRDEFHVPADDDRFSIVRGDGAHFVRYRPNRFEVLFVDGFDSDGLPARLSSQRFYDDCRDTLQPDGIMVANLHYGHRDYGIHLERIHRSFNGSVLVVDDGEMSNSIVFACKGPALERYRPGVVRRPKNLDSAASTQLLGAFALVTAALKDKGGFKAIVRQV